MLIVLDSGIGIKITVWLLLATVAVDSPPFLCRVKYAFTKELSPKIVHMRVSMSRVASPSASVLASLRRLQQDLRQRGPWKTLAQTTVGLFGNDQRDSFTEGTGSDGGDGQS
jgi:hypothetical protein